MQKASHSKDTAMSLVTYNHIQSLDGEQDQLRGTCLTDSMKRRMIQHWGERNLPHLNYTCITDQGAQALLDLDREAKCGRPIDWSALHLYDGRELGDAGITALAQAFVQQSIRNQSANPTWLTIAVQSLNNELAVQLAKALKQNLCWYRLELLLWIGVDSLQALIQALHTNRVWKELHLYNNMDDDAAIAVAQALQHNTVWTFLDLCGTIGNTDGLQALAQALSVRTAWTRFELSGCRLRHHNGLACLARAISTNPEWEAFALRETQIDDGGMELLANALMDNTGWRVLDVSFIDLRGEVHAETLALALRGQSCWKYLILNVAGMGDQGLQMIRQMFHTSLNNWHRFALHLGGHSWEDADDHVQELSELLLRKRLPKDWKSLVLWFPHWSSTEMTHLTHTWEDGSPDETTATAEESQQEQDQHLFWTNLSAENSLRMANYLGQCWQSMDLSMLHSSQQQQNDSTDELSPCGDVNGASGLLIPRLISLHHIPRLSFEAALALIQSIPHHRHKKPAGVSHGTLCETTDSTNRATRILTTPNFSWTRLSLSHLNMSDIGANMIAKVLQQNKTWQILDLAHTAIDDHGIAMLMDGMKEHLEWHCLNVSHTKVGPMGAQVLGMALLRNVTWSCFSISHNRLITDEGLQCLALGIAGRPWHTIDLGFTKNLSDTGLKVLSRALMVTGGAASTCSWRHLRLSHCDMGDSGVIRLALAMRQNLQWQRIDLGDTFMTSDDMEVISDALEKNPEWNTLDLRHAARDNFEAKTILDITQMNPTWKAIEYKLPSSPNHQGIVPFSDVGIDSIMNEKTHEKGSGGHLVITTKTSSGQGSNEICLASQAKPGLEPLFFGFHLEMAIDYGQSLITSLCMIRSRSFLDVGKILLEVSESLARINRIRLSRNGGTEWNPLQKLPPALSRQVESILSFGMDLAEIMQDKLDGTTRKPLYDVFISFAGEVRCERDCDYVEMLQQQIERAANGEKVTLFVDSQSMRPGETSCPTVTMFKHILTSRVVVSVASTHYVQKRWPMAEFLCALARNKRVGPLGHSPLIVDAMPGLESYHPWFPLIPQDTTTRIYGTSRSWLDDLIVLFPPSSQLPPMQKCYGMSDHKQGKSDCARTHCIVIANHSYLVSDTFHIKWPYLVIQCSGGSHSAHCQPCPSFPETPQTG